MKTSTPNQNKGPECAYLPAATTEPALNKCNTSENLKAFSFPSQAGME